MHDEQKECGSECCRGGCRGENAEYTAEKNSRNASRPPDAVVGTNKETPRRNIRKQGVRVRKTGPCARRMEEEWNGCFLYTSCTLPSFSTFDSFVRKTWKSDGSGEYSLSIRKYYFYETRQAPWVHFWMKISKNLCQN